jgi:transcriptional regulator with XRE-family HTH domain
MVRNRIAQIRAERGLTQRELAEAASTSQQQIQRIESGDQSVKLDLAVRICAALNSPLVKVFPGTSRTLRGAENRGTKVGGVVFDRLWEEDLEKLGIDTDPLHSRVRLRLQGGACLCYPISGMEKKRLWSAVLGHDNEFVVFDSLHHRIVVRPESISACEFLFDYPTEHPDNLVQSAGQGEEEELFLRAWFRESCEPVVYRITADSDPMEDGEDADPENGRTAQFQHLIDLAAIECDHDDFFFFFEDAEAQDVLLRCADTALLEIPRDLNPRNWSKTGYDEHVLEKEDGVKKTRFSEEQIIGALKQNRRLKHLVADLTLDKEALKAVIERNGWSS